MIGAEWVSTIATIVGIPWWGLITIKGPLWLFIVFYAILSECGSAFSRINTYGWIGRLLPRCDRFAPYSRACADLAIP